MRMQVLRAAMKIATTYRRLLLGVGAFFHLNGAFAAESPAQRIPFPDPRITVSGLGWWQEQPKLQRLPDRLKAEMPSKVWRLSQCSNSR